MGTPAYPSLDREREVCMYLFGMLQAEGTERRLYCLETALYIIVV